MRPFQIRKIVAEVGDAEILRHPSTERKQSCTGLAAAHSAVARLLWVRRHPTGLTDCTDMKKPLPVARTTQVMPAVAELHRNLPTLTDRP